MTRKLTTIAGSLLGITLATWAGPSRGQAVVQPDPAAPPGAAEKTGGALDNAGRRIRRGLGDAADSVQRGWDRTKAGVHNMGVESRLYGRLHWDKALTAAPIQVEIRSGGVAVLRGSVSDAAAKAKAEALAADTVGVVQVVSELAVAPPTPSTTTATPAP